MLNPGKIQRYAAEGSFPGDEECSQTWCSSLAATSLGHPNGPIKLPFGKFT